MARFSPNSRPSRTAAASSLAPPGLRNCWASFCGHASSMTRSTQTRCSRSLTQHARVGDLTRRAAHAGAHEAGVGARELGAAVRAARDLAGHVAGITFLGDRVVAGDGAFFGGASARAAA